jgi:hypothetical protein
MCETAYKLISYILTRQTQRRGQMAPRPLCTRDITVLNIVPEAGYFNRRLSGFSSVPPCKRPVKASELGYNHFLQHPYKWTL